MTKSGPAVSAVSPPDFKLRVGLLFRYGFRYLKLYPNYVATFVILSLTQTCIQVGQPVLLGRLTDQIQQASSPPVPASPAKANDEHPSGSLSGMPAAPSSGHSRDLVSLYILWSCLLLAGLAVGPAVRCVQTFLDAKMSNELRDRLFGILLRKPPEFFHANEAGSLTMTINQMSVETQMTLRQVTLAPILQPIAFLLTAGTVVFSFHHLVKTGTWMEWAGVGVVLLVALLLPWAVTKLGRRLRQASTGLRDQNLSLAALVTGALASPEEIQSFRAEETFSRKHRRALVDMLKARFRQTLTLETVNTANAAPSSLLQVLIAGVAVLLLLFASDQQANAGSLVAIVLLAPQLMTPVKAISALNILAQNSWPSVEKVVGFLEQEEQETRIEAQMRIHFAPQAGAGDLSLMVKSVSFRYHPDLPPVFDNVSFEVPPGKITGLVARMGQGKTTFFRLSLRFYDPQAGQILIGGTPTVELPKQAVRERVALMSQFPTFFHDTLRENLRMAQPDASDQEMEVLCRRTGIWPLLEQKLGTDEEKCRLPNPLDRQFAGGVTLSGGQKKLLALTRCLLRTPTHLLLDEPTTGMSADEEYGLIEKLRQPCAGRTVIVVNHTVNWLLRFCNHFVVLDQGKIVQQGGKELAEQPGLFRELLLLQTIRTEPDSTESVVMDTAASGVSVTPDGGPQQTPPLNRLSKK